MPRGACAPSPFCHTPLTPPTRTHALPLFVTTAAARGVWKGGAGGQGRGAAAAPLGRRERRGGRDGRGRDVVAAASRGGWGGGGGAHLRVEPGAPSSPPSPRSRSPPPPTRRSPTPAATPSSLPSGACFDAPRARPPLPLTPSPPPAARAPSNTLRPPAPSHPRRARRPLAVTIVVRGTPRPAPRCGVEAAGAGLCVFCCASAPPPPPPPPPCGAGGGWATAPCAHGSGLRGRGVEPRS